MKATGTNHGDRAHAVLSPSGAERWLNCTPSARLGEQYPEEESDYAKEGTLAHEFAEAMLRYMTTRPLDKEKYESRIKELKAHRLYYEGMIKDVEPYVNTVLEQLATDKDAELHIEGKFSYSEYVQDGEGLCDASVIAKRILYITDLKFGQGVRVSAEDNAQLKLYALGALMKFDMLHDIETVRLTIVQPRIDNVSVWDITPADLYAWAKKVVKPIAKKAFKGEGELKTGDWCKFCKAKVNCTALKREALMIAANDFSEDATEMHDAEILHMYRTADRITDYLEAVKSHVFKQALAGKKWEGLKLVEGKSNRSITNEQMARHVLIKAGFKFTEFENAKLKGIGDLEKLFGGKAAFEKALGSYVDKPKGKPTLAPDTDPRPVYSSADDFKTEEVPAEISTDDLL